MARRTFNVLALIVLLLTACSPVLSAALPACNPPIPNTTCEALKMSSGDPKPLYLSTTFEKTIDASPAGQHAPNRTTTTPCPTLLCDAASAIFSGKSTDPSAPETADCALLETWAAGSSGHWLLSAPGADGGWTPLVATGTCAVVARAEGAFAIGTEDVADLLGTSIRDYGMGDRVEVLGVMPCAEARGSAAGGGEKGRTIKMEWWVVRPDMVESLGGGKYR
ncbi:hypothetical protein HYQ44_011551 [Verticillium longisporum]|nr:hypothetical protein HYQ44_011551 [Verticillium longisporum]